jgi:hypothetical protein
MPAAVVADATAEAEAGIAVETAADAAVVAADADAIKSSEFKRLGRWFSQLLAARRRVFERLRNPHIDAS